MVVPRLVQVRFPALTRNPELLFQFLARHAALEDAVELLGVDVEGGFFGGAGDGDFGGLLLLLLGWLGGWRLLGLGWRAWGRVHGLGRLLGLGWDGGAVGYAVVHRHSPRRLLLHLVRWHRTRHAVRHDLLLRGRHAHRSAHRRLDVHLMVLLSR